MKVSPTLSVSPADLPKKSTAAGSPAAATIDQFTESYQGKAVVYGYNREGKLEVQGGTGKRPGSRSLWDKSAALGKRVIFPPNMETSVSKDYLVTRGWLCAHRLVQGVGDFPVGAAALAALANDSTWGAAVQGGAAMATFGLIRNYLCNSTGFLTSFFVDKAEQNPRAWMVAGEALQNVGGVVGACATIPSVTAHVPGGLLSVTLAAAAISTAAGVMRGAAVANVNQRQATDGNLAQVNIANSHQEMFVGFAASAGGAALMAGLHHYAPGTAVLPAVAAVTGVLGTLAMTQWVKNLDYHPVTERGLRRVVGTLDEGGKMVGPGRDQFKEMLSSLFDSGSIELGADHRPATLERSQWLSKLYQGRNYRLDVQDGQVHILLRNGCGAEDRCQAVLQAIHLEDLKNSSGYAAIRARGSAQADLWLMEQSLARTPQDMTRFLGEMKEAGWSIDIMKFSDSGRRVDWKA